MSGRESKLLLRLKECLPRGELLLDRNSRESYSSDTWMARHTPNPVALPRSSRSVCEILRFANQHRLPVTARGAGFGYVGGCVPVRGGIVLSLAQMNRIKEINFSDAVAVVDPGVPT